MNKKVISDFQKMIDVNTPIIYVNDYDFVRIDEIIVEIVGNSKVFEWNPATGTTNFKTKESQGLGENDTLEQFLRDKYTVDVNLKEKFLVLKDIQDFIEEPAIKSLLQLIAQRKLYDRDYNTTVIIVSSVLKVPQELEKYVSYLDIPFPEEKEINQLIDEHVEVNCYDNFKDEDRKKLMDAVQNQTPAFIAYSTASTLSYYVFSYMGGGTMVFTGVTKDDVRAITISNAPNPDESYNITYETVPLFPVVYQYIKKEALSFPNDNPWLSSWASTLGMSFGDIIGAVCDKGNNKHYYGTIAASVDSELAIPCGCILFLDETEHPLESDECRNISINFTIALAGPSRNTEADAISAIPASVWLRVFSVWKGPLDTNWHAPLSPSQGIDNGIFVNLDSIHLERYANLNSVDNKYYANARAKITVSVIGNHWSYTYER